MKQKYRKLDLEKLDKCLFKWLKLFRQTIRGEQLNYINNNAG